MADHRAYPSEDDEATRLLRKILSPAEAQSLVLPPPDHAPASGPAESTPLTGNLAAPPSQATPSRSPDPGETSPPARRGLAGYFAGGSGREAAGQERGAAAPSREASSPGRAGDAQYVKVYSNGQVGYLPRANLHAARQIDANLKVLDEA